VIWWNAAELTRCSETVEKAKPGFSIGEETREVAEELTQILNMRQSSFLQVHVALFTVVAFGECVRIDYIKPTEPRQLIACYEILPFPFEDCYPCFLVPAEFLHAIQNVAVRFDDDMSCR
jgi:hypothetical protein